MTALQTAVLDLADARDFAFAGGKAVNLAELLGAGFPVPDGFCVGTPAYAQAADTAGIAALLGRPRPPGPGPRRPARHAHPRRRRRRGHRRLPRARRGGAGRGAVVGHGRGPPGRELRGSAGHLPQRGRRRRRAGRGAPLLGVALDGPGRGLPRRRGHPARGHPARRGGAADGRRAGRGRAVHRRPDQRSAQPQRARRRPRPWRRRRLRRGRPRPLGGRRTHDHRSGPAAGGCLTDRQVRDLVELGRRVEAHFGAPQDIEWALDGEGTLWLTQSRAITTLYPVPPQRRPGLRVHLNASLAQGLTRPITPMGLSAFRVVGASLAGLATGKPVDPMRGPAGFGIAGDRAFIDITAVLRNPVGRKAVPADLRLSWRRVRRSSSASCSRPSRRWRPPVRRCRGPWRSPGPSCGSCSATGCPRSSRWPSRVRPPPARWSPRAATSCARAWPSRSPATGTPGSRTS